MDSYSMLSFGIFLDLFLYLINLLLLKEFFGISQIWTASDSNNRIKWEENDIHVTESSVRSYLGNEKKFRTSYSGNTTTNMWPNGFKFKKKQANSKNHEICLDLMISYVEVVVKIWEGFGQSVMYDVYKPKYLRRRIVALRRIR